MSLVIGERWQCPQRRTGLMSHLTIDFNNNNNNNMKNISYFISIYLYFFVLLYFCYINILYMYILY